jgi:type I restriction enzyme M protein
MGDLTLVPSMDEMDAEAEELGGARSFFAGDYARFGRARLMAPSLGGFEVLALHSEAIQKMNETPGVPPLFRDIFRQGVGVRAPISHIYS